MEYVVSQCGVPVGPCAAPQALEDRLDDARFVGCDSGGYDAFGAVRLGVGCWGRGKVGDSGPLSDVRT